MLCSVDTPCLVTYLSSLWSPQELTERKRDTSLSFSQKECNTIAEVRLVLHSNTELYFSLVCELPMSRLAYTPCSIGRFCGLVCTLAETLLTFPCVWIFVPMFGWKMHQDLD